VKKYRSQKPAPPDGGAVVGGVVVGGVVVGGAVVGGAVVGVDGASVTAGAFSA
jgi:hypothetical protein